MHGVLYCFRVQIIVGNVLMGVIIFFWNSKIVSVVTGKIGIPCGMRHHREISVSHILRWNSIADGVEAGRM